MAPGDGVAHRSKAVRLIAGATGQQEKRLVQPRQQGGGRQCRDTRRRQFQREWHTVKSPAYSGTAGSFGRECKPRVRCPSPYNEQFTADGRPKGTTRKTCSPVMRKTTRLVDRMVRPGHDDNRCEISGTASSWCSRLSSTSSNSACAGVR